MAIKRDYSSFSKACERYFAPMVAQFGIKSLGGIKFGRPRDCWIDGLFFQQSSYGSGDFCVNVGFNIPKKSDLWQSSPSFGLCLGGRLSVDGVSGGDCWLPASNKQELMASLQQFAAYLQPVMAWYDEVRTFGDLIERCRNADGIGTEPPANVSLYRQIPLTNHAFMLFLAGRADEAKAWLLPVEASLLRDRFLTREGKIVYVKEPGARVFKATKYEIAQLAAIRALLSKI